MMATEVIMSDHYPYRDGDFIVIGPESFMDKDRTVLCYQGTNWVPQHKFKAFQTVLADRERELLTLKGPCSNQDCRLHYAHSGPCDTPLGEVPSHD